MSGCGWEDGCLGVCVSVCVCGVACGWEGVHVSVCVCVSVCVGLPVVGVCV